MEALPYEIIDYIFSYTGPWYILGRAVCKTFAAALPPKKIDAIKLFRNPIAFAHLQKTTTYDKFVEFVVNNDYQIAENNTSEFIRQIAEVIPEDCRDDALCCAAAESGYPVLLEHLDNMGFELSDAVIESAIKVGCVPAMEYLHNTDSYIHSDSMDENCSCAPNPHKTAIKSGCLDMVKYIIDIYGPDDEALITAARYGELEILKYLHEHGNEIDDNVYEAAALNGHFECFKYCHAFMDDGVNQKICRAAMIGGNINILNYLLNSGMTLEAEYWLFAMLSGINTLKWLHEHNCPMNHSMEIVTESPSLEIIKYLHSINFNMTDLFYSCVREDDINCMKYIHENGYKWSAHVCEVMAMCGNLTCLRYAHEHGAPWTDATCITAVEYDHIDILKYAHENGCPWTSRIHDLLFDELSPQIVEYLNAHPPTQ